MSVLSVVERIVRGATGMVINHQADATWPVRSTAGEPVTVDRALGLPAVFRAIRLFSESGGALPLITYSRQGLDRERASGHPAYGLLHDQPNEYLSAVEFWTMLLAHFAGWGRMLIGKERAGSSVAALHPMHPADVTIERLENGRLQFRERRSTYPQREELWSQNDVIYARLFTLDGITGLSPIGLQREAMGLGIAQRKHAGRFFRDYAIPPGALSVKEDIKDPAVKDRMRAEWKERHQARGDIAILDNDAKFETLSVPYKDAQFVEIAGLNRLDIADAFNMPASLLGAPTGDSLTYGNRESDVQQFLTFTLHNPLKKIEQALKNDRALFPPDEGEAYPEFLREDLLQPDSKSRANFYRLALDPDKGWMNRPEVRERENLPRERQQLEVATGPEAVARAQAASRNGHHPRMEVTHA